MCNCGQKRQALARQILAGKQPASSSLRVATSWQDIPYIFTGKGHFSVQGTITGKTYYFPNSGAIQVIDYRDVSGLRSVRMLRRQTN